MMAFLFMCLCQILTYILSFLYQELFPSSLCFFLSVIICSHNYKYLQEAVKDTNVAIINMEEKAKCLLNCKYFLENSLNICVLLKSLLGSLWVTSFIWLSLSFIPYLQIFFIGSFLETVLGTPLNFGQASFFFISSST